MISKNRPGFAAQIGLRCNSLKRFSLHAVAAVLRYRLLLGTLFIAALAGLCWLDYAHVGGTPPGAWLFPLALLLSVLASGEVLWLLSRCESAARRRTALCRQFFDRRLQRGADVLADICECDFRSTLSAGRFALSHCAHSLASSSKFGGSKNQVRRLLELAATIFGLAYVGILLTFVVQLPGLLAILSLVIVVKMGDTGAYTVGRLIGRHKMAPKLSPGKTWEGAGGAVAVCHHRVVGRFQFAWHAARFASSGDRTVALDCVRACGRRRRAVGRFGRVAIEARCGKERFQPVDARFRRRARSARFHPVCRPVAYLCWATGLVS